MGKKVRDLLVIWLQTSDEMEITFLTRWVVGLFGWGSLWSITFATEVFWDQRLSKLVHKFLDLDAELTPNGLRDISSPLFLFWVCRFIFHWL